MLKKSGLLTTLFSLVFAVSIFAQEMEPAAAEAYNSGNQKLKAGNYTGALQDYETALKTSDDYRIYYQKGIALKKTRKYQESIDAFKKVLEQVPNFDAAYSAIGGAYFALGNMEKAIENFKKVKEVTERDKLKGRMDEYIARAYAKLGGTALTDGNTSKAIDYLEKAVGFYDLDAAYLTLARVQCDLANYDACIDAAYNALKHRSKISKGGPNYYLGLAYKFKGNTTKAKEHFQEAVKDPTYKASAKYELETL